MTSQERQKLIAQYKEGYNEVSRSLEGFPVELLTAHPIQGKWSAAEIVHHLADSETASGLRLRRLLVEDHPLIQGYDQDAYAGRLHYNNREMAPALDAKTHQIYTVTAEFGQAPAPTTAQPRPRAPMVPGSFTLLILSR